MSPVNGPRDPRRPLIHRDADGSERTAPSWESLTERLIREAHESGAFDDLPHNGRPLPLEDETHAGDMAMAYRVLRNAGAAPPWIETDREARRLEAEAEALAARASGLRGHAWERAQTRLRELAEMHAALVQRLALLAPTPRQHRRPLDLDAVLRRVDDRDPSPRNDPPRRSGGDRSQMADDADAAIPDLGSAMADELVAWGRVIEIETTGRRSGLRRTTPVGFVVLDEGSLAVAATDPDTQWARNLLAEPRCRVRDERGWRECVATPLEGADHGAAVSALVLRYGTPAERLGTGPSFRLRCGDGAPLPTTDAREPDTA